MILFKALFLNKFASLIYLLTICVVLCPVIAIILLSSAPDSAATVANPDLKLCPAKFLLSIPANLRYSLIIKDCLRLAGIENQNFSGHSLRSGFATVAADSGADERSIMAMTGHKTTQMVRRYIRDANIFKNSALSKIKI